MTQATAIQKEVSSTAEVFAWHFTCDDGTTDYLQEKEEIGKTYTVTGPIMCCQNGLHASINPVHALQYAKGFHIRYCRMGGIIVHHTNKLAASERTVIAEGNVRDIILLFAADCAERALNREREAGREPDERSWKAIEAVRAYARGEIDSSAAYAAAYAAADAAADAAAYAARAAYAAAYAARAAADAAARAAADAAARAADAAARAARAAADAAAYAETQWQAEELDRRLKAFLKIEG